MHVARVRKGMSGRAGGGGRKPVSGLCVHAWRRLCSFTEAHASKQVVHRMRGGGRPVTKKQSFCDR